jgi:primosomal protein N'
MADEFDNLKYSIYYQAKLKAVEGALTESTEYFYRKVTRWYSNKFHTPLLTVRRMPFMHILQEYYESQVEDYEYNDLYDMAVQQLVPEFMRQAEKQDEAFAQSLVEEQQRTLERKKRRDQARNAKNKNKAQEKPSEQQSLKKPQIQEFNMDFEDSGEE